MEPIKNLLFEPIKPSNYNIFLEKGKTDRQIIYNTFNGSLAEVSDELATWLKLKEDFTSKSLSYDLNQFVENLKKYGFLIDHNFDEKKEYLKMHQKWKTGKELVSFNVLLTYDCNLACPYCYQGRGSKGKDIHNFEYMSSKQLESTINFIKLTAQERESKVLELVLYGGEPFLVPDKCTYLTEEIANWCKEKNIEFRLQALSNGTLFDDKMIAFLSKYNCRLQIPLDGPKSTHDKYRFDRTQGEGSYHKIIDFLKKSRNSNIETHLRISLTEETYPLIGELLDDLKRHDLTHVYPDFCYITAFTDACANFEKHCLSDLKLFKILPQLWDETHKKGFPLDIRPQVQPLPCSSIADGSFIADPFGDVYKCWELVGLKDHIVGKIDEKGKLEKTAIYGNVLKRNPLTIEQCSTHDYLPACGGGCVCKSYWKDKTYHSSGCGTEKYLLEDKILAYLKTLGNKFENEFSYEKFHVKVFEGQQSPKISHCYVLV